MSDSKPVLAAIAILVILFAVYLLLNSSSPVESNSPSKAALTPSSSSISLQGASFVMDSAFDSSGTTQTLSFSDFSGQPARFGVVLRVPKSLAARASDVRTLQPVDVLEDDPILLTLVEATPGRGKQTQTFKFTAAVRDEYSVAILVPDFEQWKSNPTALNALIAAVKRLPIPATEAEARELSLKATSAFQNPDLKLSEKVAALQALEAPSPASGGSGIPEGTRYELDSSEPFGELDLEGSADFPYLLASLPVGNDLSKALGLEGFLYKSGSASIDGDLKPYGSLVQLKDGGYGLLVDGSKLVLAMDGPDAAAVTGHVSLQYASRAEPLVLPVSVAFDAPASEGVLDRAAADVDSCESLYAYLDDAANEFALRMGLADEINERLVGSSFALHSTVSVTPTGEGIGDEYFRECDVPDLFSSVNLKADQTNVISLAYPGADKPVQVSVESVPDAAAADGS